MKNINTRGKTNLKFLTTMILIGVMLIAVVFSDTATNLFINGKTVETKDNPQIKKEVIYVPIEAVVKGMGHKYQWNATKRIGTITLNDGNVFILQSTKSTVKVNGKIKPLETKVLNGVEVPVNVRTFVSKSQLFVPLSFVQKYLKFPVVKEVVSGKTNIYIGKAPSTATPAPTPTPVPKPTPTPTPTPKPTPTPTPIDDVEIDGVATADLEANTDWVVENLGFQRNFDTGAMYNPRNKSIFFSVINIVGMPNDAFKTGMLFKGWTNDIYGNFPQNEQVRPIAKKLFKFYFPTEGEKFFELVDGLYNGVGEEYMEKIMYFDNRAVYMYVPNETSWLSIYIGNEGDKIVLNKEKMKFEIVK